MLRLLPCLALLLGACADSTDSTRNIEPRNSPRPDSTAPPLPTTDAAMDAGTSRDSTLPPQDRGTTDAGRRADRGTEVDAGGGRDMAPPAVDMAPRPIDMAPPPIDMAPRPIDMAPPPIDMAPRPIDMAPPPIDMAPPPPDMGDPGVPPGRRACANGPGWTLFEVHWGNGGSSARVDHWDASCEYSIRINDACGAFDRCGDAIANCNVAVVDGGRGLLLDGRDDLLFRFNVRGIQFNAATIYFEARGTRGGGQLEIWSPIYGGLVGPIMGGEYQWLQLDWTEFLTPADDPGLTGIRFRATQSHVAVSRVEVCLQR